MQSKKKVKAEKTTVTKKKSVVKKTQAKAKVSKVSEPAPVKKSTSKKVTKSKELIKKYNDILRFKKITKGVHIQNRKMYKFGDILECKQSDLSPIAKRHFKCLDKVAEKEESAINLKVEKTKDGKYNVINPGTGKAINEKALSKEDAERISGEKVKG